MKKRRTRKKLVRVKFTTVPSFDQVCQLRRSVAAQIPSVHMSDLHSAQSYGRRVSTALAKAMRARGWLAPHNEGYAPGSWAAPVTHDGGAA